MTLAEVHSRHILLLVQIPHIASHARFQRRFIHILPSRRLDHPTLVMLCKSNTLEPLLDVKLYESPRTVMLPPPIDEL